MKKKLSSPFSFDRSVIILSIDVPLEKVVRTSGVRGNNLFDDPFMGITNSKASKASDLTLENELMVGSIY
jgi:hypothetical protein